MYRGTANELDDRLRARGATVSMYGEALGDAGSPGDKDVYVENEELKEGKLHFNKLLFFDSLVIKICHCRDSKVSRPDSVCQNSGYADG